MSPGRIFLGAAIFLPGSPWLSSLPADEHGRAENLAVMAEVISLSREDAGALLRGEGDDESRREKIEGWLAEDRASLGDALYLRVKRAQTASVRSVEELIYGTEGDPPEIPNEFIVEGKFEGTPPITQSMYAAFDTREVGTILEFWGNLDRQGADGNWIVQTEPKFALLSLKKKEGVLEGPREPKPNPMAAKWQPRFHTAEIDHPMRVPAGKPVLAGTLDHATDPDRQWWVFLTVWVVE